ncbi:hypothetical protein NQZ79_g8229 [Umbelopsis isabellina]|nr:hypothetical protein NQZ79_g8229 [Umbelopsis isabellina]
MGIQYKDTTQSHLDLNQDSLENAKREYTRQMRLWTAKQIKSSSIDKAPEEMLRSRFSDLGMSSPKRAPSNCAINAS